MNEHKVTYLPFWKRYMDLFDEAGLTNAQIGVLVKAMMRYQFEGEEPRNLCKILSTCWIFIKKDLDEAKVKYMQSVNNGKKGAAKQAMTIAAKKLAQAENKPELA